MNKKKWIILIAAVLIVCCAAAAVILIVGKEGKKEPLAGFVYESTLPEGVESISASGNLLEKDGNTQYVVYGKEANVSVVFKKGYTRGEFDLTVNGNVISKVAHTELPDGREMLIYGIEKVESLLSLGHDGNAVSIK